MPNIWKKVTLKKPTTKKFPLDLPYSHRGPFRIEPIDDRGTVIAAAGWRTDCISLANRCRSIAMSEAELYAGSGSSIGGIVEKNGGDGRNEDWGRVLAERASYWMAQCAYSEGVRSLSCAALIVACHSRDLTASPLSHDGPQERDHGMKSGQLYLVDGTAAHRVRAHAIGYNSNRVNKRLISVNFLELKKEEGAQKLLEIVTEEGYGPQRKFLSEGEEREEGFEEGQRDGNSDEEIDVPKGVRVEMAVVDHARAKFQRIRQQSMPIH
mmetsp:Transcript_19200/g.28162  ORF Transcript_19200/g.28162 Transcript_19200/m.28162 type:complete len:267 (-) Transcript_19200:164-964(-)